MKRLLVLALALSVVSCDTTTKAVDGTSSETQTTLQALADNVRKEPEPPGAAPSQGAAARVAAPWLDGEGPSDCYRANIWVYNEWRQSEEYSGFSPTLSDPGSTAWWAVRNEPATDSNGRALDDCPDGYMVALAQQRGRAANGERLEYEGRFWRDGGGGGMTNAVWRGHLSYPSGFIMSRSVTMKGYDLPLWVTSRDDEYTFSEGRFSFLFRFVGDTAAPSGMLSDSLYVNDCVPIQDRWHGGAAVGTVCRGNGLWTIRDASGRIVAPGASASREVDDSIGVRVLSTRWDGDSLRIAFRVQTASFTLRQWTRTKVAVSHDDTAAARVEELHSLVFADTNFVGPRRGEIALHGSLVFGKTNLELVLSRAYGRGKGIRDENTDRIGGWPIRIPERNP